MIRNIIVLAVILLTLVGCSNQNLTEEQAEAKVKWLVYFGVIDDGNIYDSEEAFNNLKLNIKSQVSSYVFTLDNGMILTMDKETGIIYCVENQGQKICDQMYITYLDGGIIFDDLFSFDDDSFSCVPGEPKAAADDSGMICHQEIIDKYNSLKESLITRR